MRKKVIIIGASGHGKVVADIIQKSGDILLGFLDDNKSLPDQLSGITILGTVNDYKKYSQAKFIIAIGNAEIRERISKEVKTDSWYTAIHPNAVISKLDTRIDQGTVVMANAVINPGAVIGKHCIINTGAIVEHDNTIEDYVHVSVGAQLAGNVRIGRKTWVGIGTTIKNNVSICSECTIGAGAVVVKDIVDKGIYVGLPAKRI